MYSIGQFSIMLNVNKKTLRYYDEIGLFKPVYVDKTNQYRYYGENQIEIIKEIIRLRDIGIPLEQISTIVKNKNHVQLMETYNQRLHEIEESQKLLERQKCLILNYKRRENSESDLLSFLTVEKGYFIREGFVYYFKVNSENDEIYNLISEFYEKAGGISLQGSHIFKMSLEDDSYGISEIFAYTSECQKDCIRKQESQMCLRVDCIEMKQKADGYKALFDYAEKNSYPFKNIYEKYYMAEGKMYVEIIGSINQLTSGECK